MGMIAGHQNCSRKDAMIILEQLLPKMRQPPLTEGERNFMQELDDEADIACLLLGASRSTVRDTVHRQAKLR